LKGTKQETRNKKQEKQKTRNINKKQTKQKTRNRKQETRISFSIRPTDALCCTYLFGALCCALRETVLVTVHPHFGMLYLIYTICLLYKIYNICLKRIKMLMYLSLTKQGFQPKSRVG
jgi:hypothetical protein